jgi:hypothetical protein
MAEDHEITSSVITEFLRQLREIASRKGFGTVADELGIDRKTLERYWRAKKASRPSFDVIVRAILKYEIVIEDRRGFLIGQRNQITPTFERGKLSGTPPVPVVP